MRHSWTVRRATAAAAAAGTLLWLAAADGAHAQINIGGANPLTYSQNFDSLPSFPTGTSAPTNFTDNGTLLGLYTNRPTFRVSNGSDGTGAIHSFGVSNDPDRALGSVSSGASPTNLFAFRFVNTGTTTITNFQLSYTGELWRIGLNSVENTLFFEYAVFASNAGSISGAGYTGVSSLNFTESGEAAAVGGVTGPIRTQSLSNGSGTAITLNPGEELWGRWRDIDNTGSDHGMGVDNATFTFSTVVLPEPGSLGLMALGGGPALAGFVIRRRRRRSGSARRRD